MQKIYKFVKYPRLAASVFVILLSTAGSCALLQFLSESGLSSYRPRYTRFENSLYQNLRQTSPPVPTTDQNDAEMNIAKTKNANSTVSTPSISVVSVKNASTGEIRQMDLEEYVLGVLLGEMPQSFSMQALMAQAVAIRSFTVRLVAVDTDKHTDCDVCTDYRHCQSFVDAESVTYDISRAREAVESTRGVIAVYHGEPILAAYHAASVDRTRSASEVWGGDVAYLAAVAAPESREASSLSVSFEAEEAMRKLRGLGFPHISAFTADETGLVLFAENGDRRVSASTLARAFGLRSDAFSAEVMPDGALTFTSYGYGHGVGMSQIGADTLAENGFDALSILKYYYTGISFTFIT